MAIEVFWGSGSGPAWRVLLALEVKKVAFESRLLSFSKGEHKSEAMLAMNPRGKVPVLRDGEYSIYESLAILTYIDRKHPTPPLFGTSAEDAAAIMRTISEHDAYGLPAISAVTRPILFGDITLAEDRAKVTAALPLAKEELTRLEVQLGSRSWLTGDAISAADLFVFPALMTLDRAFGKPGTSALDHGVRPLSAAFPNLAVWVARIEAIPGYAETYPPHWRDG